MLLDTLSVSGLSCLRAFALVIIACAGTLEAKAAGPSCAKHPDFTVVDFSMPVTELRADKGTALNALEQFGVETIIRYYDHASETIGCKTLLADEAKEILAHGFNIAVVFQHNNGDPETFFSKTRGREDARRSLALAAANGQPYGSTIYFGVDGADQVIADMVDEYGKSGGKPMTEARKAALLKKDKRYRKHIRFYARFLQYKDTYFKGILVKKLRPQHFLPFVEAYFSDANRVFQGAARYFSETIARTRIEFRLVVSGAFRRPISWAEGLVFHVPPWNSRISIE